MEKESFLALVLRKERLQVADAAKFLEWSHQQIYKLCKPNAEIKNQHLKRLLKIPHLTQNKLQKYHTEWLKAWLE